MAQPFYKKFELNLVDNELTSSAALRSECDAAGVAALAVHLVEVEEIGNPSELALELIHPEEKYLLPFHLVRSRFLFQNGVFVLDTKSDEKLYLQPAAFTLRITGDKPFKLTLYTTGIQKV